MNKYVLLMMSVFFLLTFSVTFGMYNPKTGRFLQQDSLGTKPEIVFIGRGPRIIGTKGPYVPNPNDPMSSLNQYIDGMNLYEYVKSHPIMLTDPTGGCSDSGGPDIPPDIAGAIPEWIVEELIIDKGIGGITGALCASMACDNGDSSKKAFDASHSRCWTIFSKYNIPTGHPKDTAAYLQACINECDRLTATDEYKENCVDDDCE